MQNKPNLPKSQMDVYRYNTTDYENKSNWTLGENKPNSNPISQKAKMDVNLYVIEDYENKTAFRPRKTNPNKPNFRKAKMNLKSLAKKSGHTLNFRRLYFRLENCLLLCHNHQKASLACRGLAPPSEQRGAGTYEFVRRCSTKCSI